MIAATLREKCLKLNAVVSSSQQRPPRPTDLPNHTSKEAHTLSLTLAVNLIQPQTFEDRRETSKVGVWKAAATFTAPPQPPHYHKQMRP